MNSVKNAGAPATLRIEGKVSQPLELNYQDLCGISVGQVSDISRIIPSREGDAVTLASLLALALPHGEADYLGLHSSRDDFHASVPLAAVRESGLLIYRCNGLPLSPEKGGPFRFFIPQHDRCHTSEVDECANVKFVDRLELTAGKGWDNRPQDESEHAALHKP